MGQHNFRHSGKLFSNDAKYHRHCNHIKHLLFWNDFILPQILLQNKNARTLQLAIYQLFGENVYQWNIIMPALLLAILPIVIFFILMQNKIVEGVAAGAVKS